MELFRACSKGSLQQAEKCFEGLNAREQATLANIRQGKQTALHQASSQGNLAIVQLLVRKGADINARNKAGLTLMKLAEKKGHQNVVAALEGTNLLRTNIPMNW
eukprot:TRINITY_DN12486_c0_g1_i1.p3 TRINITY_DN12486_c0_g1~~TRINITY_DN12486_c0_g1_i1.p3  ORF type:complete len:104 (+),score=10.71 TRINITY_DN12486_c0_g1_i1:1331-1642(+)